MEKLGNLCDFISGVTFSKAEAVSSPLPGYLPILRAGNIGDTLNTQDDFVWVPSDKVSKEQLLQVGDIVMCMSSGSPRVVGKSAWVEEQFTGSAGAFCSIIRSKQREQQKYLAYWFKSEQFLQWRDSQARGINIQNLRASQLRLVEIPLPPLPEQQRIAAILGRADRLRRLRRTARELSDTCLQSVFLEMFGDPVSNPRGWEYELVEGICDLVRGSSPRPQGDPRYFGGPVPRVMIADITRDGIFVTPQIDSLTEEGARRSRPMKAGSVVMVVSGAVGLPAVLTVGACIHDGFVGFRGLDDKLLPIFLGYLLTTLRTVSQSQATGAIWQNLTTDQIKMWRIVCPPYPLQQQFAHIVHKFERLRAQQREAERQAEHLFQALLQRAFTREAFRGGDVRHSQFAA